MSIAVYALASGSILAAMARQAWAEGRYLLAVVLGVLASQGAALAMKAIVQ